MNVRHVSNSLDSLDSEQSDSSYPAIDEFWRREEKKSLTVTFSERKLAENGRLVPRAPSCE